MRCRVRLLYFFFMLSKVRVIKAKANHLKLLIGMMGWSLDLPLCQLNLVTGLTGLRTWSYALCVYHFACFLSSLLEIIQFFSVCQDFYMAYTQVTHVSWTQDISSAHTPVLQQHITIVFLSACWKCQAIYLRGHHSKPWNSNCRKEMSVYSNSVSQWWSKL